MDESRDPNDPSEPRPDATPDAGTPPPAPGGSRWESFDPAKGDGGAPRPPTRFSRVLEAVAWIVGFLALLFFGRVYAILAGSRSITAYEAGRVAGTILFAVLVGIFVRWLVVKVRRRGRLRSPWILVVASLVLLVGLGGRPIAARPAASGVPITTYLAIEPPYSLATPTAEETEEFKAALGKQADAVEVRRVIDTGELVGFLAIADMDTDSSVEFLQGIERGFEEDGGGQATQSVVGGKSAVVGTSSAWAAVIWVEPPHVLSVYGIDEESARVLAESVIAGYE